MIKNELQRLGLSEKEAKVYLASLELGPNSILEISKKAGLKRPTTHYTVERLIKKGLVSSFEKGKKRYFSAESPERLLSLIAIQKRKVTLLGEDLRRVLPALNNIFNLVGEQPRVRFFEGKEGLKAIQEDFLRSRVKTLKNIYPRDDFIKVFSTAEREEYVKKREKKKIKVSTIYTTQKGPILLAREPFVKRKFVPYDQFPFSTDITIYGDKVSAASYKGKLVGVIIESGEIAQTLRLVFNLAWEAAGKY